jgi:ribosomal protein S18 acetylase RimI-like enzyme
VDNLGGIYSGDDLVPERLERVAERIRRPHGFTIKAFGPKEDLRVWVKRVAEIYTEAFWENRDFYPLTNDEMEHFASSILSIVDRRLVKLVLRGDEVVGFLLSYPNIGRGLQRARGHLWPIGWAHLFWEKRMTRHLDVNGVGVLPPYQGMGVNALLYCELAKSIQARGYRDIDIVHVDETNVRSRADQEALGVHWAKRHRSYYREL